ncbi:MAG: tetratricopeptide repeat protein [Richelia sp. RM1_1_1]|nr:tetratricopeptide repeat protein [Richelia sp. RM1_1_1]
MTSSPNSFESQKLSTNLQQDTESAAESVLAYLQINAAKLKSIQPHLKRSHYRAVINWLSRYKVQPNDSQLKQVWGCLQAFHHLCEVEAWDKAAALASGGAMLKVSLQASDKLENTSTLEPFHVQLGNFGYYNEQIKLYQRLLGKLDYQWDASCLNGLGLAHRALGKYYQSIEFHKQQLTLTRKIGDKPKGHALRDRQSEENALCNLGNVYGSIEDYQEAINYYQQALKIAHQISNHKGKSQILGNLGLIYRLLGNHRQAIKYHIQQLKIAQKIEDKESFGNALGNLGILYYFSGDYQLSIEHLQQSLLIAAQRGNKIEEAMVLGSVGNVYYALQNYSVALDYLNRQLTLSTEIGFLEGKEKALGNLAVVYHSQGKYQEALNYHQQKLVLAKQLGDRQGEANTLTNLGNTYTCLGEYEKAIECHKQSLAISAGLKDNFAAAAAIHNLSDAYRLQKDFALAVSMGMRSLHIFDCINSPQAEMAMITLSKIALEIGLEEYVTVVEEQLEIIKQQKGGEAAVERLRELLFEN